jgi:hypothetical protein
MPSRSADERRPERRDDGPDAQNAARGRWPDGPRDPADLSRRGAGRRQDLRHARRGVPPPRPRRRRRRGVRRDPRSRTHRRPDRRPARGPAQEGHLPRRGVRGDGPRGGARPQAATGARRRAGAHERARLGAAREALAGHPGAARRRYRRHQQRQHPAPRVAQRRRTADHRRGAARDRAGRGRSRGRSDRADRPDPRGAAPPDGTRQHLPGREDRRRTRQLLPARQPHRAARAGPAVVGRPRRGGHAALPRAARHHRDVGDARADRRGSDRRARRRHADPPRRPHRRAVGRWRVAGRTRQSQRRPCRGRSCRPQHATAAGRVTRRQLPLGRRRRRRPRGDRVRAQRRRDADRARREPPPAVAADAVRRRHGVDRDAPVRAHRRAHGHPRLRPARTGATVAHRRADSAAAAGRTGHRRRVTGRPDPDLRRAARPALARGECLTVHARGDRHEPGRRLLPSTRRRDRGQHAAELLLRRAALHVHHRCAGEHRRAGDLPAERRPRLASRRPRRAALVAGGSGQRRGRDAVDVRGQPAPRRAGPHRAARTRPRDVRHAQRQPAQARDRRPDQPERAGPMDDPGHGRRRPARLPRRRRRVRRHRRRADPGAARTDPAG